jgi:hypothetical protein
VQHRTQFLDQSLQVTVADFNFGQAAFVHVRSLADAPRGWPPDAGREASRRSFRHVFAGNQQARAQRRRARGFLPAADAPPDARKIGDL